MFFYMNGIAHTAGQMKKIKNKHQYRKSAMSLYMNGIAHTAGQMKKIKKQTSVTPVRSVTPVSQVRSVLLYERYNSYCRTSEKMKNSHPQVQ